MNRRSMLASLYKDPFRLHVDPEATSMSIDHETMGLSLGSCFAEEMGTRMRSAQLPICVNPFGILYNPISIEHSIRRLMRPVEYEVDELVENRGYYYSFEHHGRFRGDTETHALAKMNRELAVGSQALGSAKFLIVTFGSAHAWFRKSDRKIVANCHRFQNELFERTLLDLDSMKEAWVTLVEDLSLFRPHCNIILTVSPVRYRRDGLIASQRSKARLIELCHGLSESFERVSYFPAYEILIDELRDYRFFARDMCHPADVTMDYVWDRFCQWAMDESIHALVRRAIKLQRVREHRGHHPEVEKTALRDTSDPVEALLSDHYGKDRWQRFPKVIFE